MIRHNNIYLRSEKVQYKMSVVSLHKEPVELLLREEVDNGHRRQQPDNPPQFQGRVSTRGSAKYKNTERIWALIPVAE